LGTGCTARTDAVDSLELDEETEELFLYKNAERVFAL